MLLAELADHFGVTDAELAMAGLWLRSQGIEGDEAVEVLENCLLRRLWMDEHVFSEVV